jgi:hypothetical protein
MLVIPAPPQAAIAMDAMAKATNARLFLNDIIALNKVGVAVVTPLLEAPRTEPSQVKLSHLIDAGQPQPLAPLNILATACGAGVICIPVSSRACRKKWHPQLVEGVEGAKMS